MFDLDLRVLNIFYRECRALGGVFGFGFTEGLVLYSGLIVLGINQVMAKKVKK